MARAKLRFLVADADGNVADGTTLPSATLKLYQPGTGSVAGSSTSGTAFVPPIYDAVSGGAPRSTTITTNGRGMIEVWTDVPTRVDVGVEQAGSPGIIYAREAFEVDTAEVLRSGNTSVFPLEQFGFGNGTTTDQAAIAACLTEIGANGGGVLQAPSDATIDLTGVTPVSNLWIRGAGPSTVFRGVTSTNDAKMFSASGTFGSTSALASNASEGARAVTIQSGGVASLGITSGDIVMLTQTANGWPYFQLCKVRSVASDTVNLYETLADAYTTANSATLRKLTSPIENLTVSDCTLDGNLLTGTTGHGLYMVGLAYPVIRDVILRGFTGVGVLLYQCYGARVTDLIVEDSGTSGYGDAYFEYCSHMTISGLTSLRSPGFGPSFNNVVHSRIANLAAIGAVNRSIKLAASSYNTWSNVEVAGGTETGLSITTASHHNVINGAIALGHTGTSAGLWIGDGFSGAGLLPSHHNVVSGYIGRFDQTQDLLLDADSADNVVVGAIAGVVVDAGLRNVVRVAAPTSITRIGTSHIWTGTAGQEKFSKGATASPEPTTTATAYSGSTMLDGDGTGTTLRCDITTTGGCLEVEAGAVLATSGIGTGAFIGLSLDGAAPAVETGISGDVAGQGQQLTIAHTFTLVSAGTHRVEVHWRVLSGTATAKQTWRYLRVREGEYR